MEEFKSGGVPHGESIENLSDWRILKAEAQMRAQELVAGIDGYDQMNLGEKIHALNALFDELEPKDVHDDMEKNKNRFVARFISLMCEKLIVEKASQMNNERVNLALAA